MNVEGQIYVHNSAVLTGPQFLPKWFMCTSFGTTWAPQRSSIYHFLSVFCGVKLNETSGRVGGKQLSMRWWHEGDRTVKASPKNHHIDKTLNTELLLQKYETSVDRNGWNSDEVNLQNPAIKGSYLVSFHIKNWYEL